MQKILVVDDNNADLEYIRIGLGEEFSVTTAMNSQETVGALKKEVFDVALIDVRLGPESGISLGKVVRDIDPQMAIILITGMAENYRNSGLGFDDYVIKGIAPDHLAAIVRNAIYQRRMSRNARIRRLEMLRDFLPECKEQISDFHRLVAGEYMHGDVERLTGTWMRDRLRVSWVVYNLPEHGSNTFTVGVASTVGCGRGCQFCLSADQPVRRVLDWKEIVCQVLYGLDSFHARGIFEVPRKVKPYVNFTCEGEPFVNLENVMEAVRCLSKVKDMGFEFIITSVGLPEKLQVFISRFSGLKNIRHYWSVNSCIPEIRGQLMPSTRKQNIREIRDLYQRIAELTGRPVTASFILIPGLNDSYADVQAIADLFGNGRPFEIKLQAYVAPPVFRRYPTAAQAQLKEFKTKLERAGLVCRIRNIVGAESFSGCGSTVSGFYPTQARRNE